MGRERTIGGVAMPCLSWDEVHEIAENGMGIGLLAYEGRSLKRQYDEQSIKESVFISLKIMKKNFNGNVGYCAFKEGAPEKLLWNFLRTQGFQAIFTQTPTNRRPTLSGIGRIQIDDDDDNIFLAKISKIYLFFKDKRSWKYIRKYKIDKLAHRISKTLDRIKRNKYTLSGYN